MKAQIAIDKFIGLAIVAIVMLVIILGVYPVFKQKLGEAADTSTCNWNIFMAGIRKGSTFSIAEGIPEGCKAKRIELTLTDVQQELGYARNRLKAINSDLKYKDRAPSFSNNDEKTQYQFAMNKVIADELAGCWSKVIKGKIPIFDEWWRLYNCKDSSGATKPCSKLEDFLTVGFPVYGAWNFVSGKMQFSRAPTNCIVCARIKFDDTLVREFPNLAGTSTITTAREWMAVNPWKTGASYLEFVQDGQAEAPALLQSQYAFDVGDTPLAVVYARINVHQLEGAASWAASAFGFDAAEDVSMLRLVPYTQRDLLSPEGLGCTFILE
jgi:hypothetical protein